MAGRLFFASLVTVGRASDFTSDPPGYVCHLNTDISGGCDFEEVHTGKNITELAEICSNVTGTRTGGCSGFNSQGILKRCVMDSCGASTIQKPDMVTCIVTRTHDNPQPTPEACPVHSCGSDLPPFKVPEQGQVPLVDDWHYPPEEVEESNKLSFPSIRETQGNSSATLVDPDGNSQTLKVGEAAWGWLLVGVMPAVGHAPAMAILEQRFDRWSSITILGKGWKNPITTMRKPIGKLEKLNQHRYYFNNSDSHWDCKQDVDPTDWLGRIAAGLSGNDETSFQAAASVMAPNEDVGIFGNPEEQSKWVLLSTGTIQTYGFGRGKSRSGQTVWNLQLPSGCGSITSQKGGLLGRYLRALSVGMLTENGCGAEVTAVSATGDGKSPNITALLRVNIVQNNTGTMNYIRLTANQTDGKLLATIDLGDDGWEFHNSLLQQTKRWDSWVAGGTVASLPASDRRYTDQALALLTAYLNLDRGFVQEYGLGKFANEYNEYLPLDTLALNGALLEWGQHATARDYLEYFFDNYINATTGKIIYSLFGCDGDPDYGRLLRVFAQAVRYSGDVKWANKLLPVIEKMAGVLLEKRAAAEAAFPTGNPLHGIVPGSPEHDICGGHGHFFSINVWYVRGLSDLQNLIEDYSLSHNQTLEKLLKPTCEQWRADINFAANYTAVRDKDGGIFFLHPCVGSDCTSWPHLPAPQPGGEANDCVDRGTCFASMSAEYSNQLANYAGFRIFSETVSAGVLEQKYEKAILTFRETHRGTMTGMTRFRSELDDMPMVGYGWGALYSDKIDSFHTTLAGHSANYLSRGTFWATEQRLQLGGVKDNRMRNPGSGGEDGSLCMVSAISPAFWIRWMLVQESLDEQQVFIARGARRSWYQEAFGVEQAPTRFGLITYTLERSKDAITGFIEVTAHPGAPSSKEFPEFVVRLRGVDSEDKLTTVTPQGATVVSIFAANETVVLRPTANKFSFSAAFASSQTLIV